MFQQIFTVKRKTKEFWNVTSMYSFPKANRVHVFGACLRQWSFWWASSFFRKQVNVGLFQDYLIFKNTSEFSQQWNINVFGNMLITNLVFVRKWDLPVGGRKGTVVISAAGSELEENFKGSFIGREDLCAVGRGLVHILF